MLSKVINYADRIMLDIMDGIIVETHSLNFNFNLPSGPEYEAHLMVDTPIEYLQNLNEKISRVIIHVGKQSNNKNLAQEVRETGREFYAALNLEVDVSILRDWLSLLEGVLMSAQLDTGCQACGVGATLFAQQLDRLGKGPVTLAV